MVPERRLCDRLHGDEIASVCFFLLKSDHEALAGYLGR
jgi:hypothetical protein